MSKAAKLAKKKATKRSTKKKPAEVKTYYSRPGPPSIKTDLRMIEFMARSESLLHGLSIVAELPDDEALIEADETAKAAVETIRYVRELREVLANEDADKELVAMWGIRIGVAFAQCNSTAAKAYEKKMRAAGGTRGNQIKAEPRRQEVKDRFEELRHPYPKKSVRMKMLKDEFTRYTRSALYSIVRGEL